MRGSDSNTELKYIVELLIASLHLCCLVAIKNLSVMDGRKAQSGNWTLARH